MNGLTKETWVKLWKPELESEAGMIYDALNEIHTGIKQQWIAFEEHPQKCRRKYITRTQMVILILAVLAFGNIDQIWPLILKFFM